MYVKIIQKIQKKWKTENAKTMKYLTFLLNKSKL